MLHKNNIYEGYVTGYTSEGLGVLKIDGQVVFVKNAVREDFLAIKIIKTNKKIAFGIIDKIITPSNYRISAECGVSNTCGGCELFNMTYEEELYFKKTKVYDCLTRLAKVNVSDFEIFPSNNVLRYRNKAQFPIRDVNGEAFSGFYRSNSHNIVKTRDCLIQTEKTNEIVNFIVDFMNKHKIKAYNEENNTGFIRNIYIRTGFISKQVQVCLVTTNFNIPKLDLLQTELLENFKEISSLILNKNNKITNVVLGENYKNLTESSTITDVLCENKFKISPESFYQVNHNSAENLYKKAVEYCEFSGNETALDMYCGVGTITLFVSKFVSKITGIEIVPKAINNAKMNAELNKITNAEFIVGDAKDAVKRFISEKIDVIIVDPPRKGLDIDTINSIITISPQKIAYISCDPATLARDVKIFAENGYVLKKACAFDLFPRTKHVESIVLMSKLDNQ